MYFQAEAASQAAKYLPWRYEKQNLIPRAHKKNPSMCCIVVSSEIETVHLGGELTKTQAVKGT